MALTAMWTHGNSVVSETPAQLEEFTHLGFGTQVRMKARTDHWFHVPMPSPVILNGARPKLRRVIMLINSDVSTCIKRVHVFDGNDRLQDHEVTICGNKLNFSADSVVETGGIPIVKALGISMFIPHGTATAPLSFFFGSFGADWE